MSDYEKLELGGRQVLISAEARKHEKEYEEGVSLLKEKLEEVQRLFPKQRLQAISHIKVWVEWNRDHNGAAVYHPSRQWLEENGLNPNLAKCVEVSNLEHFLQWTRDEQPMMILHELSHALHDHLQAQEAAEITATFQKAVSSKKYEKVPLIGRPASTEFKAYALTDEREFFAETCESFFGVNDYFPHTREQLKEHDPTAFALMSRLFGENPPVSSSRDAFKNKVHHGQTPKPCSVLHRDIGADAKVQDVDVASINKPNAKPANLTFSNETTQPLDVVWVDGSGNGVPVGAVATSAALGQNTYDGHAFKLVSKASELPLAVVVAGQGKASLKVSNIRQGDEKKLRLNVSKSAASNWKTRLSVVNKSSKTIRLNWVEFDGNEQSYGQIEAGKSLDEESLIGHVWVVKFDEATTALKIVLGAADSSIVIE